MRFEIMILAGRLAERTHRATRPPRELIFQIPRCELQNGIQRTCLIELVWKTLSAAFAYRYAPVFKRTVNYTRKLGNLMKLALDRFGGAPVPLGRERMIRGMNSDAGKRLECLTEALLVLGDAGDCTAVASQDDARAEVTAR